MSNVSEGIIIRDPFKKFWIWTFFLILPRAEADVSVLLLAALDWVGLHALSLCEKWTAVQIHPKNSNVEQRRLKYTQAKNKSSYL